ncbi:helical backbone metal receptor [Paenibacillus sp. GM2]|uniref:helical backbone metal receptor n=1 Tax=Paenibacillus sp. GM2 TaxID=1622070 RepID=UPI0008393B05|nr:helical backbone metal receptor [Paenibacillus sp. GM2]
MNKISKILVIISLIVLISACANSKANNTNLKLNNNQQVNAANRGSNNEAEASTESSSEIDLGLDEAKVQEIVDQFGGQTPTKTVTLSVAITELYNALGLELAGVPTTMSTLPAAYDQVQRIGSSHAPDLEQIAKLEPDAVVAPASIKDSIAKMIEPAGLPAVYLPVDSLDELKQSMAALGKVYDQEEKANEALTNFAAREAEALKLSEGKEAPTVMFLFGSVDSLMLMNEDTFAGSLAKKLGASNVLSNVLKQTETYVPMNMESVVQANPDIILLVAHGDPSAVAKKFEEDVKQNGAWEKMDAFKNNKLITLDYNLYGIASLVKAPDAYKDMASILYND